MKKNSEDFKVWTEFKNSTSNKLSVEEVKLISRLHSKYFNHSYYEPCTCSAKTYHEWIGDLNKLYRLENQ